MTDKKFTDKYIKEAKDVLRYFDEFPQASVILDYNETIIFANKEAKKLLRSGNFKIEGMPSQKFLPRIGAGLPKDCISIAQVTTEGYHRLRLPARRLDGSVFYMELKITGIPFRGTTYVLASFEEISKQRQDSKKLAWVQARFGEIGQTRNVLDTISESFCIIDDSWKIRYWNSAAEMLTQKSRGLVLGRHMWQVFPQEEGSVLFAMCHKSMKERVPTTFEHFSGEGTYFYNAVYPNDDGGITIYFKNISERKNREREREILIKELTRSNSDLLQFSFITSHNLRAPLSNILGLVELLDKDAMDEETGNIISMIASSASKLSKTIGDLSEMLLIKNKSGIAIEMLSISEVFERVNRNFLEAENEIDAHILVDLKEERVAFNEQYLESIFINLISNAIKYRNLSNRLSIEMRSYSSSENIIIEFSDNGLGIDLSRHGDRLFGMYQRFHAASGGQGLGLFIVKSQVDALGGSIEVLSKVGEGTTFRISFPKEKNLK